MNGRLLAPLAVCLVALAGCAGGGSQLRQALLNPSPPVQPTDLAAHYLVRCPDVLGVRVEGRPDCCGPREVGFDGCIALAGGSLRVAGSATPRIVALVARELRVPPSAVQVVVAEYRSQQVYLVGEVAAERQAVEYRGPETIVELLRRAGLTSRADIGEVRVVRSHVADGKPPEVFHVDLRAILIGRDPQTNIRVEPSDHVHIEQRRPSRIASCLPPWLRPAYQKLWGVQ